MMIHFDKPSSCPGQSKRIDDFITLPSPTLGTRLGGLIHDWVRLVTKHKSESRNPVKFCVFSYVFGSSEGFYTIYRYAKWTHKKKINIYTYKRTYGSRNSLRHVVRYNEHVVVLNSWPKDIYMHLSSWKLRTWLLFCRPETHSSTYFLIHA